MTELLPGWVGATLGDVTEIVSGSTPRTAERSYWDGDIPWITPDDLSRDRSKFISRGARSITEAGYDSCSTQLVPAGTVLYSSRAPIGYVAIAANPVCTNQGFKSFVPSPAIASDFLYWFLAYATPQIQQLGSGTTFPELSRAKAREIPITVPPLAEQRRIVAAIEEQISRLESAARALLSAQTRLLAARKAVLASAFADFGNSQPLANLADPTRPICYGILKPKTTGELVVPYVEVRSIRDGRIDLESLHRTTLALHREFARSTLRPGDVVMAIRGSWDRAAVVPNELDGANVSRDVARIAPLPDLDSHFLAYFLASPSASGYFARVARGVGVRGVNIADLRAILVPYPPRTEQEATVERIETALAALAASGRSVTHAVQSAQALRRSILARAFRGELVPQDPDDEPASALLERIAAERTAAPKPARRRREKARA